VFRTVGEAVGKAFAVIASAVDDLPNVMGRDDVCKDNLGRLLGADCGARASISVVESECSEVRLFVFDLTRCVGCAGAVGFIARASISKQRVLVRRDRSRELAGTGGPGGWIYGAARWDGQADTSVIRWAAAAEYMCSCQRIIIGRSQSGGMSNLEGVGTKCVQK
jgi:hypothetical protein